jgi:hypothetical protein
MVFRPSAAFLAALCLSAVPLAADLRLSKQDADRFQLKLSSIVDFANAPRARAASAPRSIDITDAELNSYLRYHARADIPTGIVDPVLSSLGGGRVGGYALVDLDAVRTQKPRGWLDPLGYLTGRLPITVTGSLATANGVGRFQLENAEISGITIPKTVLQELLSYYSRTADNPAGINMDDPFELPARIREIKVGSGRSTVVQQ